MQLSAGDKLGPYEIVAQIGAGGMGYRRKNGVLWSKWRPTPCVAN